VDLRHEVGLVFALKHRVLAAVAVGFCSTNALAVEEGAPAESVQSAKSIQSVQSVDTSNSLGYAKSMQSSNSVPAAKSTGPTDKSVDPVVETMEAEMKRNLSRLKSAGKAPLYFLAYRLYDCKWDTISASNGGVTDDINGQCRMLSVDLRVGSAHYDNTHFLRGRNSASPHQYEKSSESDSILPSAGAGIPLRQCLWLKTDEAFKAAQQRYSELLASNDVLSAEEDRSDDFSFQPARHYTSPFSPFAFDRAEWTARVRRLSQVFNEHPSFLQSSSVTFTADPITRYIVTSEGSQIIEQRRSTHFSVQASTLTKDGMTLGLWDAVECPDPKNLPDEAALRKRVEKLAESLEQLRQAPAAEPYVGPAILSGKAAAVFYHETFGHRVEAVHEKSENEGKTFARKLGTSVMPSFLTIIDDPTKAKAEGEFLNGHYVYDDEGVPARPVTLARNGVLTGFLLGRTLVHGFNASNGHGRSSAGWNPVARQGNLFVLADKSKQVSPKELRAMLIAEAKRQHKEYGLYFDQIAGGSTYTASGSEQTYFVNPLVVYKIFVDGRPDQLIRGAEIVGTPLAALEKVLAAGNDPSVFNGKCGRESGPVLVSGVSPSLLLQSIEVKRKAKTFERAPILPEPRAEMVAP
jgi:TldD protein